MRLSRQDFLLRAVLSGGVAAAGPPLATALAKEGDGDIGVLNYALAFEHLSVVFYRDALRAGGLRSEVAELARTILQHEEQHAAALARTVRNLGGTPVRPARADFGNLAHESRVLRVAQALEDLGVSAYNGAATNIRSKDVLAAAGAIVQVEARHASAIRNLRGNPIAPAAFDQGLERAQVGRGIADLRTI